MYEIGHGRSEIQIEVVDGSGKKLIIFWVSLLTQIIKAIRC